ncbi:hypothetical protein [Bradyrhizobium elkanii]|jgi:hypothetical protein|uniref:hypothetical protein n=1 Tax=Bradyrhizobium elkanii TaxID=29448 RepID=UPI002168FD4A|nr:hypothetical protein [Bradyrhizobium elkanii]MCS3523100.1 hypothetical protein [Bradyrhizobium elkanii]MCS4070753.1 hypothetical protein [Bradyrhizobium elkanii]MCS4077384.1 hypothetical protein [Bradyrhizobium elkanii]MCW2124015.1 hypothetical protein [Bradyrhizobium elkanii]MCW2170762.1 hypothetical protein [Bradyrhizobium elkanii]
MVGEIISEWWATSNRNGGRDHSGTVGDIERNQQAGMAKKRTVGERLNTPAKRQNSEIREKGRKAASAWRFSALVVVLGLSPIVIVLSPY